MSTTTNNYGLTLPEQQDYYNVDVFNENFEKLDAGLNALQQQLDGLAPVALSGNYNHLDARPYRVCTNVEQLKEAIEVEGGLTIYLPPGEYSFKGSSRGLYLLNNGINIIGSGINTVINVTDSKLSVQGSNVSLQNLKIYQESGTAPLRIVSGQNKGSLLRVRDCCISSPTTEGLIEKTNQLAPFIMEGCVLEGEGRLISSNVGLNNSCYGIITSTIATKQLTLPAHALDNGFLKLSGCFNLVREAEQ